ETEGLVGFFVNSLAIRISADAEAGKAPRLGDLLERARTAALGAYAHQDFPFDRLVAELGGSRGGGIPPVYQVALVLQNLAEPVLLPGLRTTVEELDGGLAKLDLALAVVPFHEAGADSFAALLELNLDLFDPATGARMLRGFEAMAREIAAHPDRLLAEAELLGRAERHQMLIEWRGGDRSPAPVLLQDWIARHALERPWDLALESEHEPGRRYTWSELAAHTDALARRLAALGAGPERVVGVSLERSVDRPLAMFAIWKAGACYLPVDPELPVERRALLLADANAVVLIAREEFFVDLPAEFSGRNGRLAPLLLGQENGLPVDLGPEAEPLRALPENLAYIIYTSGSTGTPKGVAISHRHAAGHFAAAAGFYQMDSTDRVVQFAAASFDVSMEQVGVALASGGTLVVRGPDLPLDLSAWMTRHKITNANLPTAVWTEWSRSEAPLPRDLRVLVTGGEAMTPAAAERFRSRLAEMENPPVVYNGYGPTETVVTATCYDLKVGRLPESGSVSIGRALPGRTALVVDAAGRLQTLGGIGELVLGGLIARGYFARPELTAERFRPDPFAERAGARIYWTGDRVRQRGDGSFDYLGRTDQQIKVRGFRIEPGEIEAALAQHRAVHDSIVLAREVPGAGPRLIAWYRPEEPRPENTENVSSAELRAHLAALLPDYMVPAAFVEVAEWPITPTGKIDRRALPGPQRTTGLERTPPGTSVQRLIADLWREALPELGEDLAIEDSFFELGGHSLLAVRITSKVAANFQVELPLKRLFEAPTIAGLEAAVLAAEARPGQSEKIAGVLLRMKSLSPEAKEKLLAGG
ncbi:MAG: amino acid adenylation domain-containing protein, partial [Acidobacteriota bacterium]